jgi:hypothetical protein
MSTVSIGHYLFARIAQLGVEHIFGVPGDFNRTSSPSHWYVYRADNSQ